MELFFIPFKVFVWIPFLALIPSAIYFYLYKRSDSKPKKYLIVASLWILYTIYESTMWFWAKTVTAPIRADLLLISPVMILASIAVLIKVKKD
ncbi:MAG: hypothetical protein EP319_01070 [Deltaproteobacteria bacterium]|nr:MAG: hypothetical protein EP319_01070 [Deltaproteobacteria bacterium]